jgi:hypothetical protein
MELERSLSDDAQLNTIAFDALAFITGNTGACTFFPPGKVCDLFGFQYLRDNDPDHRGHSGEFLGSCAENVLGILEPGQCAELVTLAREQADSIDAFAMRRLTVVAAFNRLLEGDLPPGCSRLDSDGMEQVFEELYAMDGRMCVRRAEVMGSVIRSLDDGQREALDRMAAGGMESWPDTRGRVETGALSHGEHIALMTYAADLFSWYSGSEEADVYFCPERHGTCFGSFYLKDLQAMADPSYNIGENVTADLGREFLDALDPARRILVESLVISQKNSLLEVVEVRSELSGELRRAIGGGQVDSAEVVRLAEEYGRLDCRISCLYAEAFSDVAHGLSGNARDRIEDLRRGTGAGLPDGAFLYSDPIPMPVIPDTGHLFM